MSIERCTEKVEGIRKPAATMTRAIAPMAARVHWMIFIVPVLPSTSIRGAMCSRYFLDADGNVIAYTFRVAADERLRKRFNIAPTQDAPVVRAAKDGGRELAMARWGLVPFWATDLSIGTKMINARCEGVETKPAFKAAIAKRRCIVPATGF